MESGPSDSVVIASGGCSCQDCVDLYCSSLFSLCWHQSLSLQTRWVFFFSHVPKTWPQTVQKTHSSFKSIFPTCLKAWLQTIIAQTCVTSLLWAICCRRVGWAAMTDQRAPQAGCTDWQLPSEPPSSGESGSVPPKGRLMWVSRCWAHAQKPILSPFYS